MMIGEPESINYARVTISGVIGAVLGMGISFIVNSTLAEISISPFFSVYFGIVFSIVGGMIIWRINQQEDMDSNRRMGLYLFGGLVILSGIVSILLEKNWFLGLSPGNKIPLYGVLGISVSFALTFAIVDLINYTSAWFQRIYEKPPIQTTQQILLVLASSSLMGMLFGLIFGFMDVEDQDLYDFRLALINEESYCYPIGLVIGGVCGAANEYLNKDIKYEPPMDSFDDEI